MEAKATYEFMVSSSIVNRVSFTVYLTNTKTIIFPVLVFNFIMTFTFDVRIGGNRLTDMTTYGFLSSDAGLP